MKNQIIDKFFTGQDCDAERVLPDRPEEETEKEQRLYDAFFDSLTDEQKKKYINYSLGNGGDAFEVDVMYRRGFHSGARLMLEILTEDE